MWRTGEFTNVDIFSLRGLIDLHRFQFFGMNGGDLSGLGADAL